MSTPTGEPASRHVRRTATVDVSGGLLIWLTSAALALPVSILTARALGPAGKGVATLVFVTTGQALAFGTLGVNVALVHHAGARRWPDAVLARQAVVFGLASGLVTAAIATGFLAGVFGDELGGVSVGWVLPAVAALPVLMVARCLDGLVQARGMLIEAGATHLLATLGTVVAAAAVFSLGWGTGPYLSLRATALVVGAVAMITLALRAGLVPGPHAKGAGRTLVAYGLRGHLGTVSQWVNHRFDVFIVASFLPISRVGVYSVSVAAAELLQVVPNALASFLSQRGSTLVRQESLRLLGIVTRLSSILMLAGGVVLGLAAAPLVELLFGAAFRPAVPAIRILLPGVWALALWKNLVNFLVGAGHPGVKSASAVPSVVITVVLDLLLIPRWGITGAAAASSCAYTASLLVALAGIRRVGATWRELILPRRGDLRLVLRRVRSTASRATRRMLWDDLTVQSDDVS